MKTLTQKFTVIGMHCPSCAMLIEGELEDLGVKAKCSYRSQEVEVEFDADKVTINDVFDAVSKAGYSLEIGKASK